MSWPSSVRSISCWEKSTDDDFDFSGDHRVLESFLGASALRCCHRGRSAADRRLHRTGGTQAYGGHAGAAGAHARGTAWTAAAHRRRREIAHQRRHHPGQRGQTCLLACAGAALLSLAGLAIGPAFQIAQDINIGILFVVGVSALGIFGIVLGGWASNSHYSLMGALRSSAQLVSYETAAGMALVCGLLLAGTLTVTSIVEAQRNQGIWFGLLAPVAL